MIPSTPNIKTSLLQLQERGLGSAFLERLGHLGLRVSHFDRLLAESSLDQMRDSGTIAALKQVIDEYRPVNGVSSGSGVVINDEAITKPHEYVTTDRPVLWSGPGASRYLTGRFKIFQTSEPPPAGMTLVQGESFQKPLQFYPPPAVELQTDDKLEILQLLEYAGIHYRAPTSEAANFGVSVFQVGRDFALKTDKKSIKFDWDHTLSNYQIFDDVKALLKLVWQGSKPSREVLDAPMTFLESARPFMHELVMGMMVGFAIRQGLKNFDQWESYKPQVGIATHTWPERLTMLGTHFVRILSLMNATFPGAPEFDSKMKKSVTSRSNTNFVHLHSFLDYARRVLGKFDESEGFQGMSDHERLEVMAYLKEKVAHRRKPIEAMCDEDCDPDSVLHFDDSTKIIRDLNAHSNSKSLRGLLVRHPHSRVFRDVMEWHKFSVPALTRSRVKAIEGAARTLAIAEQSSSTVPALLSALTTFSTSDNPPVNLMNRSSLPDGIIYMIHVTPMTLGDLWRGYLEPANESKKYIGFVTLRAGGIDEIKKAFKAQMEKDDIHI